MDDVTTSWQIYGGCSLSGSNGKESPLLWAMHPRVSVGSHPEQFGTTPA